MKFPNRTTPGGGGARGGCRAAIRPKKEKGRERKGSETLTPFSVRSGGKEKAKLRERAKKRNMLNLATKREGRER